MTEAQIPDSSRLDGNSELPELAWSSMVQYTSYLQTHSCRPHIGIDVRVHDTSCSKTYSQEMKFAQPTMALIPSRNVLVVVSCPLNFWQRFSQMACEICEHNISWFWQGSMDKWIESNNKMVTMVESRFGISPSNVHYNDDLYVMDETVIDKRILKAKISWSIYSCFFGNIQCRYML